QATHTSCHFEEVPCEKSETMGTKSQRTISPIKRPHPRPFCIGKPEHFYRIVFSNKPGQIRNGFRDSHFSIDLKNPILAFDPKLYTRNDTENSKSKTRGFHCFCPYCFLGKNAQVAACVDHFEGLDEVADGSRVFAGPMCSQPTTPAMRTFSRTTLQGS